MLFAHDTEMALVSVAALVNTAGRDADTLPDLDALEEFMRAYQWTGPAARTKPELRAVQDLRPRLRRLWEAPEDEVVEIVNALLREGNALPQLVSHDGWPYHLHATPADAPER